MGADKVDSVTLALTEFLLARVAEDEAGARAATPGGWYWEPPSGESWPQSDESLCAPAGPDDDYPPAVLVGWGYDASGIEARDEDRAHIARHDPTRVLADCAAKRRIVESALETFAMNTPPRATNSEAVWVAEEVLQLLAQPYADHESFQEGWRK